MLYQNDDFGKDYLNGLRDGLGDKADKMIVATQTYEITDPTVDSQIVALQGSGADVLLTAAIPKFAAQAIRKVYDIGWKPTHFLVNVADSVGAVMQPADTRKAVGIISAAFVKDPTDPQWQDTAEYKEWLAWMKKYYRIGKCRRRPQRLVIRRRRPWSPCSRQCGDNLTRENVMKQAASIHDLAAADAAARYHAFNQRHGFRPDQADAIGRSSTARPGSCSAR